MQEKKVSPPPSSVGGPGLGLGSAFAALPPPPPPLPVDQRTHEGHYLWDPAHLHALHAPPPPPPHPGLGGLGHSVSGSLELPLVGGGGGGGRLGTVAPLGTAPGDLPAPPHPPYRIPPYMEHLYQSLHHPTNASFRGISPLEGRGLPVGSDYLGMSGLAATRLSDPHLIPSTLTSVDLPSYLDGTRASLQQSLRQSRKRALSSSPYSDSFDINSMIRFSPNSLVSIMNVSRSSSASAGSYGHLSAGAISPALGLHPGVGAATHLQQLQAHLIRGGSLPGSPFLAPSPLLQHPPSSLATHQSLFSLSSQTPITTVPHKHEDGKKTSPINSSTLDDKDSSKIKKESPSTTSSSAVCGSTAPGSVSSRIHEDDGLKDEPPDFVETECHWKDCTAPNKEFNVQDELVKHINNDHIHANKKAFVCRWKECSRDEKPFKAQYMLVVHMRRHTGEKPHRCTFEACFKAYSRLENLKTHLRSHTGEKPYMCEFPGCTKAFSNASDRAKHQNRTHSNEKPYVCKAPGCTKRYTDPSSLRKHVKTVHGADFYNSKKHKGNNEHPSANGGSDGDKGSGAAEGSPHSDGGKGGSLSSPSVKSEEATSPGQQNSPGMDTVVVGGSTPMDQSRLLANCPISDRNISTTAGYEALLENESEWYGVDDDLDASVDLPVGIALGGDGSVSGAVTAQERNLRNRLKNRLQAKGLANILPNIPNGLRRTPGGMMSMPGVADISQQITDLKMNAGMNTPQQTHKKLMDLQTQLNQTAMMQNNRRDSNSTVSTYYGSMRSGISGESPHPCSRRSSQFSQISNGPGGRQHILESPHDQGYGSRRSSENSNFNMSGIAQSMSNHLAKLQRRAMANNEMYNTSNLVVQTQNMSLSQENLQCAWRNGMSPAMATSMANQQGYFGSAGPLGPPKSSDGVPRRASDPVRTLDHGLSQGNGRLQRHHSYSSFNQNTNMPNIAPHHPNHGLQLDQVAEDEPIENKLVLPDDMVNYLNQKGNGEKTDPKENTQTCSTPNPSYGMPSPAYSSGNPMPSPAYSNQNMMSPAYSNQQMNSPASNFQFPSPGYSAPSPAHPQTNYQPMTPGTPQHQQFNTPMASPAMPAAAMSSPAMASPAQGPQFNQMNSAGYNQQPANFPMQQQYPQQQYPQQQMNCQQQQQQQQMYGPMMQQHGTRFPSNAMGPQGTYNMGGQGGYGPVHACGHLAPPNLPPPAYQAPCAGCQNVANGNGMHGYRAQQGNMGNWHGSQMNMNHGHPMQQHYGPHYNPQQMGMMGNMGYTANQQGQVQAMTPTGQMMHQMPSNVGRDVQCGDVSTSQSKGAKSKQSPKNSPTDSNKSPQKQSPQKQDKQTQQLSMSAPVDALSKNVKDEGDIKNVDTKNIDTKNVDTKKDTKNFMRPESYQRTLEYVQQCQSWSSTSVKEEVTSTTDQKPKLNPNGTVVGYTGPGSQDFVAPHPPRSRMITPLPTALSQTSNMIINDMTSSLTSLQEENKYLQMLQ